jgi:glutathione S-transferase
MKLYFSPGACSLSPHIVIREAGQPAELEKVDLATHRTASGTDYYGITPKGQVPLLITDEGDLVSEGPIICQYVADRAGATTLMPAAGTLARYRVMGWQNYVTSELHKTFSILFNPAYDATAKDVARAQLRTKYAWLDSCLVGQPYLTGANFTAADAYLFVVTRWAGFVGLALDDLPQLQSFMQRVAERPAVQAAMKAEGLS